MVQYCLILETVEALACVSKYSVHVCEAHLIMGSSQEWGKTPA